MRNIEDFRIDQPRTANRDGREIVLDASLLDDSTSTAVMRRSTAEGGDAIAGLRNGLLLSAAFWALVYVAVKLFLQ